MTTVAQLLAQKAALEAQIEAARKSENSDAIAKVKALIAKHRLTQ
jgi:DNA-binding protein H-NS